VAYNQLRHGIDFDKDYKSLVRNITSSDVQQVARNLLNSKRRIEVTMVSCKDK
jgi:peptidase M16 inactive domain protein